MEDCDLPEGEGMGIFLGSTSLDQVIDAAHIDGSVLSRKLGGGDGLQHIVTVGLAEAETYE